MAKTVLLTGAAGFVGAHIVDEILDKTDWTILANDRLTYAGNYGRIKWSSRVRPYFHDFRQPYPSDLPSIDYIIHNGAESHVTRSVENPQIFVESNILGTQNVLEMARQVMPERFVYISTDEVFGSAKEVDFKETDRLQPSNPYSASKAAGEMLAHAYLASFGVPIIITRTMNMFGEMQHPEKFVPMTIKKVLNREEVLIHTDSNGVSGSRRWLYARAQGNALIFLLEHGAIGEAYHIQGDEEISNLEMATKIAEAAETPLNYKFVNIYSQDAGHDLRYGIDGSKLRGMGWQNPYNFEFWLRQTVRWTMLNRKWLEI